MSKDSGLWCDCHGWTTCSAQPLAQDFAVSGMTVEETKKKLARLALLQAVLDDVRDEVSRAVAKYPPFNSAHEGWAVLMEEVDELWDEVKIKQGDRSLEAMRIEAIQSAAMAVRFAMDICNTDKVQK